MRGIEANPSLHTWPRRKPMGFAKAQPIGLRFEFEAEIRRLEAA